MGFTGPRVPTQNLRDSPLLHVTLSFKTDPQPGMSLRQLQFVTMLISSAGRLSHLDLILFLVN